MLVHINGITYIEDDDIIEVKVTEGARNPYNTGYGKRIPTQYMVKLSDNRWRRVYCMCWSNIGSLWVTYQGQVCMFDNEYSIKEKLK